MIQEERELLLKDLCGRLPYRVKVQVCNLNEYAPIVKGLINNELFVQFDYITKPIKNGDSTYNIINDNIKPYLRSMSSMTEEEIKELSSLSSGLIISKDVLHDIILDVMYRTNAIDWLNAHHFDYRDLIGRGLALPAPEGIYK